MIKSLLCAWAIAAFAWAPPAPAQTEGEAPPDAAGALDADAASAVAGGEEQLLAEELPFAEELPLAAEEAKPVVRPKYEVLRQNEDWKVIAADERSEADPYDFLKFIELSKDLNAWVSFGGQWRSRVEGWGGFGFNPNNDDTTWLNRFLYHADIHVTDYLRVFVQGKSAFTTEPNLFGGGRRALDEDEFALQNAFLDVIVPLGERGNLVLRGGRQELLLGKQRLISPLDWANTRRTFDGGSAILKTGSWTTSAFYTHLVNVTPYSTNPSGGASPTQFYGVYAAGKVPSMKLDLDLYLLGLSRDDSSTPTWNGTAGGEDRFTLGARNGGDIASTPLDYDLEGAWQFGTVGGNDLSAFMITADLGVKFDEMFSDSEYLQTTKPRLFANVGYVSGDKNPGGTVQTFNQLFPLAHAYLGFADVVGRQNIINFSTGFTCKPFGEKLVLRVDGHYFLLASTDDALYNAGGRAVRNGTTGTQDVGGEIDLTVKYPVNRHLLLVGGYSHFFAGKFVSDSGPPDSDVDFGYLSMQYTF
mgnify:CR=1 FL=1